MDLNQWALTKLSVLLPLDENSLRQVIEYSLSLSKEGTAEHLKNLLGDSPRALEFIVALNSRRPNPRPVLSEPAEAPKQAQKKKKKPLLQKLPPPRQAEDHGNIEGAYNKLSQEQVYMPGNSDKKLNGSSEMLLHRSSAAHTPSTSRTASPAHKPKASPSASGPLISDLPSNRTRTAHNPKPSSGSSSIASSAPIHDLDSALTILSSATSSSTASRRCGCQATRHALLAAAPNCLSCGNIVCVQEGLGPCTFCSTPLLTAVQIADVSAVLRAERAREKVAAHNAAHRRASGADDDARSQAQAHRDRLLRFQTENAQRTQVVDEAAAFETPVAGHAGLWGSAAERALLLKQQQKVLRAAEMRARPEWERTKVVLSLDVSGGKVVKRIQRAKLDESSISEQGADLAAAESHRVHEMDEETAPATQPAGKLSRNPLMRGLIRPIWHPPPPSSTSTSAITSTNVNTAETDHGSSLDQGPTSPNPRPGKENMWRRVQDDSDDNEALILDGGVYGASSVERRIGEEPSGGHGHG